MPDAGEDFEIVLGSIDKAFFWGACRMAGIPIERFDRQYGVELSSGDWYAPDFWLPDLTLAVEIKGLQDEGDPMRWGAYRKDGARLAVFDSTDLRVMMPASIMVTLRHHIGAEFGNAFGVAY